MSRTEWRIRAWGHTAAACIWLGGAVWAITLHRPILALVFLVLSGLMVALAAIGWGMAGEGG